MERESETHLLKFQKDNKKREEAQRGELDKLVKSHLEEVKKLKEKTVREKQGDKERVNSL